MNIVDKIIFAKYKDTDFPSYGCYLKILKCKESKLYDKINLYPVYVEIVNYQIRTYGESLCSAYDELSSSTQNRIKTCRRARQRKYIKIRRNKYE